MLTKPWTKVVLVAAAALVAIWCALSLRDESSMLRLVGQDIGQRMGLSHDRNLFEVLRTMQRYARRAKYDEAIAAGVRYTNEYPNSGSNDQVFIVVASMFLEKAKRDSQRAEDYVSQALFYRDQALPIASDTNLGWYSMGTLREMSIISESVGDLSPGRRCVQYDNAIKLLEIFDARLKDKRDEIARRFVPDKEDPSVADVKRLSDQTQAAEARVREKQRSSGCGQ